MLFRELLEQDFSSKATALEQVPATYKEKSFDFNNCDILDYGCGKGLGKKYCETNFEDCKVYNYDPYNGFNEINLFVSSKGYNKVICCNNVLNVINSDLSEILTDIKSIADITKTRKIIFKIYEGNGSGVGKQTGKDQYQRNMKTAEYVPIIQKIFSSYSVKKKGLYIICES